MTESPDRDHPSPPSSAPPGPGGSSYQHYGRDPDAYYGDPPAQSPPAQSPPETGASAADARDLGTPEDGSEGGRFSDHFSGHRGHPYGGPPPAPSGVPQQPPAFPAYGASNPHGHGTPIAPPGTLDAMAVVAVVLGVGSWMAAPVYGIGLLLGPAAVITGTLSVRRIARSGGGLTGRGLAVAGIVTGILSTLLLLIAVPLLVLLLVSW